MCLRRASKGGFTLRRGSRDIKNSSLKTVTHLRVAVERRSSTIWIIAINFSLSIGRTHRSYIRKMPVDTRAEGLTSDPEAGKGKPRLVCLDVQQVIDEQEFRAFHLGVVTLCAVSVMMDGFDAQAMG